MSLPVLAPAPLRAASENPAAVYLATQAPSGRRAQAAALRSIAEVLSPGTPVDRVAWHLLRYAHVAAVREWAVGEGYAPATINRWLAALRGVLRHSWLLGLVSADDYERAKQVPPAAGTRIGSGRALTRAEMLSLLDVSGPRDAAAFALLYGCGLRVAEACALEVGAIDLGHRTLRVIGKGNREREVPLPGFVVTILERWYRERGAWNGPVLTSRDGDSVHPNTIGSALDRRLRQAGLEAASPHDLRRTFVTLMLADGVDLSTVQALAGHADPRTTSRYDRRGTEDRRQAVERLQP